MIPATFGSGPYHPAVCNKPFDAIIWYWPDLTYTSSDEAYDRARVLIQEALDGASPIIAGWNIIKG
jgi:hypothetical protein